MAWRALANRLLLRSRSSSLSSSNRSWRKQQGLPPAALLVSQWGRGQRRSAAAVAAGGGREQRQRQRSPLLLAAAAAAAAMGMANGDVDHAARAEAKAPAVPPTPKGSARGNGGKGLGRYFVADAVEAAAPAVANITVNVRFHAGRWTPTYATQSGSGFVISEDGLVVTNAHVIASANADDPIMITLHDGRKFPARVHSVDVRTDVALLQVDTKGAKLPVAQIGQSSSLRPGEWVVALGSPQGLANTVTVGIVSAVARLGSELGLLHTRAEYIQTDAAINAGNSGGPLVNLDGEVVGINSMKLEYSDGIGFAIPIDIAWQVVQQLVKYKRVRRPYVGLAFRLVNVETGAAPDDAAAGGARPTRALGMYILEVKPGSPAERGGLQEGDVVVEIDGAPVRGLGDITDRIGLEPERTFRVKVLRHGHGGKPLLLSITSMADERIF